MKKIKGHLIIALFIAIAGTVLASACTAADQAAFRDGYKQGFYETTGIDLAQ